MKFKEILAEHWTKFLLLGIAEMVVLLAVFWLGATVGYRRASFGYRWGENYNRMFGGPPEPWMMPAPGGVTTSHGTSGSVIGVEGSTVIIKGRDDIEKKVIISKSTTIREGNRSASASALQPNEQIVVLGQPDSQGQIDAQFIRVFNLPPQ